MKPIKFLTQLAKYKQLIAEAQEAPAPDVSAHAPDAPPAPDAMGQPPAPPAPPPEKASQGYTALTNIILNAFKTIKPRFHGDVKYSDNKARDAQEAFKYLEIVKRNLPEGIQQKISQSGGKGGFGDVDELTIVSMVNLALQALFTTPKDEESSEYSTISSLEQVTPENAKQVYQQIRDFLSVVEK
jgi:hypothetical protein